MLSEADAFLDAIWAAPDDDTPRLVYADWLEEHGYPDYARFIRLSCQIARGVFPPDKRSRLRRERFSLHRAIVQAHPRAFEVPGWSLDSYDYGIPSRYQSLRADLFLRSWPHWWPFFHPRALRLHDVFGHEIPVAGCEYLGRVEALACEGQASGMYPDGERDEVDWLAVSGLLLRGLVANSGVPRLTALKVEPIQVTAIELESLAESRLAEQLEELHLWVQFADGSREDLRTVAGFARDAIARFLTAHGDRLPR
jgi:uncharacterized protein (TIGR02996 family)